MGVNVFSFALILGVIFYADSALCGSGLGLDQHWFDSFLCGCHQKTFLLRLIGKKMKPACILSQANLKAGVVNIADTRAPLLQDSSCRWQDVCFQDSRHSALITRLCEACAEGMLGAWYISLSLKLSSLTMKHWKFSPGSNSVIANVHRMYWKTPNNWPWIFNTCALLFCRTLHLHS